VIGGTRVSRCSLGLVAAAWSVWVFVQPQTRQFCVTVMDDDRKAVTGLGAEDFALKDGGARQPVVASEPARDPLMIAIVIAGFPPEAGAPLVGAVNALTSVVDASNPESHEVLVLEGTKGDPGTSPLLPGVRLHDADVVFSGGRGVGAALNAAARALGSAGPSGRRAIVAFIDGSASDQSDQSDQTDQVAGRMGPIQGSKIALWTVELPPARPTGTRPPPAVATSALDRAVQAGGGLRWRVDTLSGLEPGARGVAALLATAQYVVTIELPVLFNGPVPIATRHDRGVVLVPIWSR
jgi:hypothetical protein